MVLWRIWTGCCALALLALDCRSTHAGEPTPPAAPVSAPQPVVELIWKGGLAAGWRDDGWAPHDPGAHGPAELRMAASGGWILRRPDLKGSFGGVAFRYRPPPASGDFLEVRLDSNRPEVFPRVRVVARHRTLAPLGWEKVFIPIEELDPEGWPFDRVVIRAVREVADAPVLFDDVGLTAWDPRQARPNGSVALGSGPARDARVEIDCQAPTHPISPLIYGIAFSPRRDARDRQQWTLGATARRWGGNPTSRFNWELGNAWNAASDYFFRNVNFTQDARFTYDTFLQANLASGMQTALTVPLLGWVAKDTSSGGFPVSRFGPQEEADGDYGNGVSRDGKKLSPGPPAQTSVPAPPEFIERWVHAIREKDKKRGRTVHMYILDNEPTLWNDTHRDVHPEPTSYDELLARTLSYAHAVRKADPEAVIAGPAEWGWPGYFGSAVDQAAPKIAPDRRAHGNVPLLPWYLAKLREHERQTGERLLDVVDVHFYPQAKGIGQQESGKTDEATAALRIRSTRALWDESYRDESWIHEPIALIPRLKAWIAESYPGRGISIGEYNFGAENHVSGGLALAEALGRFGEQGITAAFYWSYPPMDSPAAWAFRTFRNYDGKGAHFGDVSLKATGAEGLSAFASKTAGKGGLVTVLLNLDPHTAVRPQLSLKGCGPLRPTRIYTYNGEPKGLIARPVEEAPSALPSLPPSSMNVIELSSP